MSVDVVVGPTRRKPVQRKEAREREREGVIIVKVKSERKIKYMLTYFTLGSLLGEPRMK